MPLDAVQRTVNKLTSFRYQCTLVDDETRAPIPASLLLTLKLTLFDRSSGTKINSRDLQNVLNTNGVTIGQDGVLVWRATAADNPIVGSPAVNAKEQHEARFDFTWGTRRGDHRVFIDVVNLPEKAS